MDTIVKVTLIKNDTIRPDSVWQTLDSLFTYWETHFSQTSTQSEILPINLREKDTVAVSPIVAEMVTAALAYGDTLEGMFDLTIFPLKELWGFGEKSAKLHIPSQQQIDSVLERIGNLGVRVHNDSILIFSDSTVTIDVGGIAKGFVLREAAQLLDKKGIKNYLISAGGDIIGRGTRSDGKPWLVGIQHPRVRKNMLATVRLSNASVVTSGDYERFYIQDSIRYHHIFNPRTGRSCRTNQSLTIRTGNPIVADVLSTGLFCLHPDSILAFVESRPEVECLGVDSLGNVFVSDGWCEQLNFTDTTISCR
ncbi:MAG: FAD:protein FMN transferase [Chitinivibrionales bacterium]